MKYYKCIILVNLALLMWFVLYRIIVNYVHPSYERDPVSEERKAHIYMKIREDTRNRLDHSDTKPWLYVITPTTTSLLQEPDITKLGQTLSLVSRVHWVIVQGVDVGSPLTAVSNSLYSALTYSALPFTVLLRTTESEEKDNIGRYQTGLNWITREGSIDGSTIVTFLEQSGSIDYRLLNWIRETTQVSSWPVGLLYGNNTTSDPRSWAKLGVPPDKSPRSCSETPRVHMEALAVSLAHLRKSGAHLQSNSGCQEAVFLEQLLVNTPLNIIEPTDTNQVYAWKTQTKSANTNKVLEILGPKHEGSNIPKLRFQLLIDTLGFRSNNLVNGEDIIK